ncbi:MAG TPA: STAS domain-containing protein [Bacillus sp. (in: firmicutes)]|nr:STAS domain-containing protein [Bacillus sp. (in: firmicutes)]
MEHEFSLLGEKILEKKFDIARRVHEQRMFEMSVEQKQLLSQLEEKELINIRANFVGLFGQALIDRSNKGQAYDEIEKWGKETGEFAYNLGIPLDEALKDTSYYRNFLSEVIEDEIIKQDMSVKTVFGVARVIDPLLDHAVYCFSLTYVHINKKALEAAKTAFLELSVPVVPLSNGIAILPLVGDIDTERARLLMEETLREAVRLKLSSLILDLSGVVIVDTMVADQLFKVISGLELIGVKTTLTGIRPEIAQTVVSLGIDFSNVSIKANLKQALSDLIFKKGNIK